MKRLFHRLLARLTGEQLPPRLPELPSRTAYAQWAANYTPSAHNPLMQAEEQAMQKLLPALAGRTVLDLACGTGRWGAWAQGQGARLVLGLDNSAAMLRNGVLSRSGQAEMDALPLSNASVGVIICGLATGHLPTERLQAALHEMARVLVPGGAACISDFHPFLAWSGAQRTFTTAGGQTLAVEHYRHSYADYFRYATLAGLRLTGVEEVFSADEKLPLVLALQLTKPT
jgi:malonyl-CoA O-methyltransferase